jgi:hypothetical protein
MAEENQVNTAAPVAVKAPKAPKAPKDPNAAPVEKARRTSKFEALYPENAKLTVLVAENPKKEGSASRERFEGYKSAKTVGDALANGVTYQDIAYDVGRQFVQVTAV